MRYIGLWCILACSWILAENSSVAVPSQATTSQPTQHPRRKGPNRKQLQQQLGDDIDHALQVVQDTLSQYTHMLQRCTSIDETRRIGNMLHTVDQHQRELKRYLKQLLTGEPALSRAQLEQRIERVTIIYKQYHA